MGCNRRCGSGGPRLSGSLSLAHECARARRWGAQRAGPMSACGVALLSVHVAVAACLEGAGIDCVQGREIRRCGRSVRSWMACGGCQG